MGVPFRLGLQYLLDSHLSYTRAGLPVYLRLQNFPDSGDSIELGVPFVPTGDASAQSGYTDILIDPPPATKNISQMNIGLDTKRLNFGSKLFVVSHTFVETQRQANVNIKDDYDVWRNWDGKTPVIGLVSDNRLFSIEKITHDEIAGEIIKWTLVGNALEQQLDDASSEEVTPT